jgi:hypothetical protein
VHDFVELRWILEMGEVRNVPQQNQLRARNLPRQLIRVGIRGCSAEKVLALPLLCSSFSFGR